MILTSVILPDAFKVNLAVAKEPVVEPAKPTSFAL
jgi:hypothetical protein